MLLLDIHSKNYAYAWCFTRNLFLFFPALDEISTKALHERGQLDEGQLMQKS